MGTTIKGPSTKAAQAANRRSKMAKAKAVPAVQTGEAVSIARPNLNEVDFHVVGSAPYVQHKFSQKARTQMLQKQQAGSTARGKKTHEARDIEAEYAAAMHVDYQGNPGIPAPAFRSAMISACRLVGFQMTKAKLSVFVLSDMLDVDDGTPLVPIIGEPEMHQASVRLESGVASVAIRPMWRKWSATVRVRYDADQFTMQDVCNLMMGAGQQVGIGEGRPDSKKSHGMGWGTFDIVEG